MDNPESVTMDKKDEEENQAVRDAFLIIKQHEKAVVLKKFIQLLADGEEKDEEKKGRG